jgi:hypothetical protein
MKSKIILTDADGVCLDWEWAFSVWMQERNYVLRPDNKQSYYLHEHYEDLTPDGAKVLVKQFNESAAIGFLPALRDAVYYVKKLHEEHGYVFHCITSLSKDTNAQKLRKRNIQKLFGKTAFTKFIILDTGADKDLALAKYAGEELYWIEDKPQNADVGYQLGLKSLLIEHGHNMNHACSYPIVKNWKQIYEIVTGELITC